MAGEAGRSPVGKGLRDVLREHLRRPRQRRDRASDTRDTGAATARERHAIDGAVE
jgi:hypothetical protein